MESFFLRRCRLVLAINYQLTEGRQRFIGFSPPRSPLRKNRLQVAFKQGAGVLEVLFGVGAGGGDAVEGLVEDSDDAVLFGERG